MRTLALNIIRPEPPLRSYAVGRTPWSAAGPLASPLGFKPSVSVFIALLLTLPLAAAEAPPTRLEALEKTVETQRTCSRIGAACSATAAKTANSQPPT